jgi:hypothetical protein
MKKKDKWVVAVIIGVVILSAVKLGVTFLEYFTQVLAPNISIKDLWQIGLFDYFAGGVLVVSLLFLWLAKKVFGKIPWNKLPEIIWQFIKIFPVFTGRMLPILRSLWKNNYINRRGDK